MITQDSYTYSSISELKGKDGPNINNQRHIIAERTAFIARFIVIRENQRCKAHRILEKMDWQINTSAEELLERFKSAFLASGDSIKKVDKDLNQAIRQAKHSADYFLEQYLNRATLNFKEALRDYKKSNRLLFGNDRDEIKKSEN